jgi:hypothetical protein
MEKRQVILLAALLLVTDVAVAAAEACPAGQKRLKESEPCIPELLFNYLYCLNGSGGGVIEVNEGHGATNSRTTELKLKGSGSGVILKGAAEVGFKQDDLSAATSELQKKLNPTLADNCKYFADKILGAPGAPPPANKNKVQPGNGTQTPIEVTPKPPEPPPEHVHLNKTSFNGFSCQTASYGSEWAERTREQIESDLYQVYGCSAPPEASSTLYHSGNFHTPASDSVPYKGFAARSTVLYYDPANKAKAEALARDLSQRYQHKFVAAKGAGQGVPPEWYSRTLEVHLRETGY